MLTLDHVGIAVASLEPALAFWRDTLGVAASEIEEVPGQQVRVVMLETGATRTELLEPTGESSPVARFLAAGKRGVHHLAYRTPDLDAALARLRRAGVRLTGEEPAAGSEGTRIAFLHPHATGGVLVELLERPAASAPGEEGAP